VSERREEIYRKLGVEERYPLGQGYNIFIPSIKFEAKNIKGVS